MEKSRRAKISEYAAGFFAFILIVMFLMKLIYEDEYFFALIGFASLISFVATYNDYQKNNRAALSEIYRVPEVKISAAERRKAQKEAEEKAIKVKEFPAFIQKIAGKKNIEIKFYRGAGTGHVDLPERWYMSQPIPLTPEEFYELYAFNDAVQMSVQPHEDGVLHAHSFYFEDYERIEYSVAPEYFAAQNQRENLDRQE